MASIYKDIRAALETRLVATANLPTQIAYENVSFEPTTGTSWMRPMFLPTSRLPDVRGLNPQQRYQGIFRVQIYCPEGDGPANAEGFANTVIEAFEATTKINYSGTQTITVSVDYAQRQQGYLDTPWYYVPVIIAWYCYHN